MNIFAIFHNIKKQKTFSLEESLKNY